MRARLPTRHARSAGTVQANANCGGRGGQIWMLSTAFTNPARKAGPAATAPTRCPGMQYALENE